MISEPGSAMAFRIQINQLSSVVSNDTKLGLRNTLFPRFPRRCMREWVCEPLLLLISHFLVVRTYILETWSKNQPLHLAAVARWEFTTVQNPLNPGDIFFFPRKQGLQSPIRSIVGVRVSKMQCSVVILVLCTWLKPMTH